MPKFDYYLLKYISNHPERLTDVVSFIYNSPPDSYFGLIGELAKENEIDLLEADIETWSALIDSSERPRS